MRKRSAAFNALTFFLAMVLACNSAFACSWAAFFAPKQGAAGDAGAEAAIAVVGRTMDWGYSDNAVVRGVKAGTELYTAEARYNPMKYTAKYASIQITCFKPDLIGEALNEKGLQGSLLYLEGAKLPDYRENVPGVNPFWFLGYVVSVFDSVEEVVRYLREGEFNLLHLANPMAEGSLPSPYLPFHYAFADASGGSAIVEFIDGELRIYDDPSDNALTNEPPYHIHKALDLAYYRPNGSIATFDRRARARLYLDDMHKSGKVVDAPTAIMAMRGLLASVFAGTEEIDRSIPEADPGKVKENIYPTQWWTVIDLKEPTYYLTRIESWCAEIYDFAMVAAMERERGVLLPEECPNPKIP